MFFVGGHDVSHNFSNKITNHVMGRRLKRAGFEIVHVMTYVGKNVRCDSLGHNE